MTLACITVDSRQYRGCSFQRCCSHPPCRSHLRGLPVRHLLCRQRAEATQKARSPSGMPWVLPPHRGGLMSEPRAVLTPHGPRGDGWSNVSPQQRPAAQRASLASQALAQRLSSAQHVSAPAAALPEADEQVVLWFNQFPGEREERRKGRGREE